MYSFKHLFAKKSQVLFLMHKCLISTSSGNSYCDTLVEYQQKPLYAAKISPCPILFPPFLYTDRQTEWTYTANYLDFNCYLRTSLFLQCFVHTAMFTFSDGPDNLSGLELYFKTRIYRMIIPFLARKPVRLISSA